MNIPFNIFSLKVTSELESINYQVVRFTEFDNIMAVSRTEGLKLVGHKTKYVSKEKMNNYKVEYLKFNRGDYYLMFFTKDFRVDGDKILREFIENRRLLIEQKIETKQRSIDAHKKYIEKLESSKGLLLEELKLIKGEKV